MTVDHASFRRAAGQFASGIVVITTRGGHAMTVSAFTSVSLDPPLVLFCAEKIARFHDAVLAEGSWAVSILAEDDEKTARWLALRGRPLDGQLDGVAHHPGPATGAPLLDDALAVLECRTTAVHDAGDHSIVVGQVEAVTAPDEPVAGPEESADPASRGPLVHYSGAYRRLKLSGPPTASDPGHGRCHSDLVRAGTTSHRPGTSSPSNPSGPTISAGPARCGPGPSRGRFR
jgi:flavin reductase (DIM6/NTAB) family NADH-FMN oxidoreductase RutF